MRCIRRGQVMKSLLVFQSLVLVCVSAVSAVADRGPTKTISASLVEVQTLRSEGKHADAERLINQLLVVNPQHPDILMQRGIGYLTQGRYQEAHRLQHPLAMS